MSNSCPYCDFENIEGADTCEECGQSLTGLPLVSSEVEARLFKDRIKDLEPREPLVVAPDTPIANVLALLFRHSVGCVTVVDGSDVVGIFSERDALMRLGADAADLADRPVRDFMTPNPETLDAEDKIAYALHKMDLGGYRHIPVTRDGKLVGIISVRHILRYITDQLLSGKAAG